LQARLDTRACLACHELVQFCSACHPLGSVR
jgi:hypothetical protein